MVRILGLFTLLVDHDLAILSSNDESLRVYNNAFDIEPFTWALSKKHLVVTCAFKEHNLTLVSAYDHSAIRHPCMTSEEIRDMSFFLSDLAVSLLQRVVLLYSEELVGVVTSDHDDVVILTVEGALNRHHSLTLSNALEGEALLLVPIPQNDLVTVFSSL